jgi:hypothetical protein
MCSDNICMYLSGYQTSVHSRARVVYAAEVVAPVVCRDARRRRGEGSPRAETCARSHGRKQYRTYNNRFARHDIPSLTAAEDAAPDDGPVQQATSGLYLTVVDDGGGNKRANQQNRQNGQNQQNRQNGQTARLVIGLADRASLEAPLPLCLLDSDKGPLSTSSAAPLLLVVGF